MDGDEDPEARIRELERSLGGSAGTTELTNSSSELGVRRDVPAPPPAWPPTAPMGPPPPYPPPAASFGSAPYGGPFTPGHPTSSTGVNVRWLVIGLMTVVTLGVIGGSAVWASNMFSEVKSLLLPGPTISGGGGPFGQPGRQTAGDQPLPTPAPDAADGPAPGGDYTVSGVGENRTIACNDGVITISGVSNQLVITGHCASVTVSGMDNDVTVDESDTITASGLQNRVTFRSGTPDIENSGSSNVVERG